MSSALNGEQDVAPGIFSLNLTKDGWLIMVARFIRLFSYGWISVGLIRYLTELDYSQFMIGCLFTATLFGDLVITFYLTTTADSFGRRTTLLIGSLLKIFAGVSYAFTGNFVLLLLAGMIGIISPTGGEIGPFLAVEQSSLTESVSRVESITVVFGWYMFLGYLAQAFGALAAGFTLYTLQDHLGWHVLAAHRVIIIFYGVFGALMFAFYLGLSSAIEPLQTRAITGPNDYFLKFGLHRAESRAVVLKLSLLFILDAFAGGFVMQTIIVYWFSEEYGMSPDRLGEMMMGANLFAGVSALAATPLVGKIGAINTMVFTHLPSNLLLIALPFMPNASWAVVMLLLRFSISQMDVPARQFYVATVVDADERSAAGGITSIVRSIGLSASPLLAGYLLADPKSIMFSLPFIVAGVLKSLYDVLLYISFQLSKSEAGVADGKATMPYTRVGANAADVEQQQGAQLDTHVYDEEVDRDQGEAHSLRK